MGAWGAEAFANDHALDEAYEMTSVAAVEESLDKFLAADARDRVYLAPEGYAAAEIIASARCKERYWQSEGTTLFSGGAGAPYVPEEVAALLEQEPDFSDDAADRAYKALELLEAQIEAEGWHDPASRRRALRETRERLLNPAKPWAPVEPGTRGRISALAG